LMPKDTGVSAISGRGDEREWIDADRAVVRRRRIADRVGHRAAGR